ncbi:TniQ family protein [Acinetobacter sp. ANC 3791]|uniref:TniQ family protein n=1 Tax=Acinetobacter sp. ANC 3791 TaxID=2529836 RepID=UPI00103ED68B|nr:TniQ family protein [Acinetobacter sp. ANC 3791]TCB84213.1 hypothetical protein E0H90_09295 [Acinetobacter sp. ANC 3791]
MKKLNLSHHPIPFSDEFIASFLLRVSYSNGYQSTMQMLHSAGILVYNFSYESIFTNEIKFKQVLNQLNLSYDSLGLVIKRAPPTSQYYFWKNNQIIHAPLLTIKFGKFCSICLNHKGYWRKDWLLNPLTICPDHNVNLISDCPNCYTVLSTNRRSLFECSNCQYDLRNSQSEPSNPDDINTNHWFLNELNSNDDNFIKIFYEIWITLREYFSNLNLEVNNSYILKLSYDYFNNKKKFIVYFNQKIEENLVYAHPRIQLLPFFRKKSSFNFILDEYKSNFKNYNNFSLQLINREFNKIDARHILGVSFSSFHKRLKLGILYHDQLANNNKNRFSAKILEDWLINEKRSINGTYTYHRRPPISDESDKYYSILEIMKILNINNSNARLFLKIPEIPTTKKYINHRTQYCLEKSFVNNFHEKYIFLSPLSKKLGVPILTLRAKLSILKIDPIYINKIYPAYYARKDIQHLNKSMLENIVTFKNNFGRKKKGTVIENHNNDFFSLNEAAQLFNLSPFQTTKLIKYNWLLVDNKKERPYRIPRKSIDLLLQLKNDPTYVYIDDVLKALHCTFNQLQKNWIMTGYLTLRHIAYWRSFPRKEFDHVLEIHKDFFTASEANTYLGMHRTHITNLVSRGLIRPYFYGNHNYSIRLFKRDDVKKLLKAGYGIQRKQKMS